MSVLDSIKKKSQELSSLLNNLVDDPSIPLEKKTQLIIHSTSLICALVAVQPLPFADLFVLTPIQVVMVTYLSRAMGNPVGDNGAKEIISYLAGVVGWGVLAQQAILGLYKTILPYAGGFTTIPLVYAATFGLGMAAKTVLEARQNDKKLTDDEIKRISKEATKKAKEEAKIKWTPEGIKEELNKLKKIEEEYRSYKDILSLYEKEINKYKIMLQNQQLEIESYQSNQLNKVISDYRRAVEKRFQKYSMIQLSPAALNTLTLLPKNKLEVFEKHISKLHFGTNNLAMNTTTDNTNILEYKIGEFARLHILAKGSSTYIQYIELDEVVVEEIKTIWNKVKFNNKCKHLVNEEIRRSFIDALTSASVEIDIVCPWITKRVLDGGVADFFEKALQKGVRIKILYGIDSEGSYYSRKDDTEIAAKELRDRFSCYGSLFRMKKSNTHYKLLICDEKFYVQGSFNFLSFEGKYAPNTRSEGAQYSENIEELKELKDYYFKF